MRILMVMTSHDRLGHTRQKTGVWLEDFAAPYYAERSRCRRSPRRPEQQAADALPS